MSTDAGLSADAAHPEGAALPGDALTNPLRQLRGAVADPSDGSRTGHYGDPIAEQRALASGLAIVDLSHRAVLSVTGEDRLSWLDSLTSQGLTGLQPGESAETLLLNANGRIENAIRVIDDGQTAWLLVEAEQAKGLLDFLDRMRFMLRVEVTDRTAEFATIGVFSTPEHNDGTSSGTGSASGSSARTTASAFGTMLPLLASPNGTSLVWRDPWRELQVGGWTYSTTNDHPAADWDYREVLIEREELADLARMVERGELRIAGFLALEALRIAAWRPSWANEVDERSVPHELDWLRSAVHLNKGCYRGQETVAKVHNLGHPPRRIVFLHLDGSQSALPAPGDDVVSGAASADEQDNRKVAGKVTSSAYHHELGPIALAVLRRTTDATAALTVESSGTSVAAAQEVIVAPDAGASANVPRLPRLGAVKRPAR